MSSSRAPLPAVVSGRPDERDSELKLFHRLDPNSTITPLLFAAYQGQLPFAKSLLERGAIIDTCDREGNTPLHVAIDNERIEVALHLINSGANINLKNWLGQTPLMLASKKESLLPIFSLLRTKGADTMLADDEGKKFEDYLCDSLKAFMRETAQAPVRVKIEQQ